MPPSTKIILPTAPRRNVSVNGSTVMPSWFDIKEFYAPANPWGAYDGYLQRELRGSVSIVLDLLLKEVTSLGDPRRVFLGGFSQGASVALAAFLQFKHGPLGGVVGLSGAHCADIAWSGLDLQKLRKTKMFLYHGEADSVLPASLAERSYQMFKEKRLDCAFETEPGLGHGVSDELMQKLARFLKTNRKDVVELGTSTTLKPWQSW